MFSFILKMKGWGDTGRGGEKNTDVRKTSIICLPHTPPTGAQTQNVGMCPDQESKLQPFGVQEDHPTNWGTQPGQVKYPD